MFFGSVKGLISFDPKQFSEDNEQKPPTYFTGFQINNNELSPANEGSPLTKSILDTDTIILNYNQNNFSIEFAALNYAAPEVTRYKYLMKGIDSNWTYLNANRKAYFTDLSYGNYEFIVTAESNICDWKGNERRLLIKILPPIWKSKKAYACYIFLIIAGMYFINSMYRRQIEKKNAQKLQLFEYKKEKEIYEAKIDFFTNVTHEIRTPLTLIAGPIEWLLKKYNNDPLLYKSLSLAEKNTKRLVELTNQLLDFRKTEANQFSLNFVNTDIIEVVNDIIQSFKDQVFSKNIAFSTDFYYEKLLAYVDKEAFVKIITNMIGNAIKYSDRIVEIKLKKIDVFKENFTITFINDGNAIPKDLQKEIFKPFVRLSTKKESGTGIGLSLARSLAELHNGTLQLISGEENNIIFELCLPIHQKFEFELSNWKNIK